MLSNTDLLSQSADVLKCNSSIAKDYVFPIASSFISAFLGVAAAKLTFRHQEKVRAEINKVSSLNKLIIKMGEARAALLAIKHNYNDLTQTNFVLRAMEIPPILLGDYKIENNTSELSFLIDKNPDYKASEYDKTWVNIQRVGMMVNNYHQVYNMISKRNELCIDVHEKIVEFQKKHKTPENTGLSISDLIKIVGHGNMVAFCDLTQSFVSFLDDVLFEINDFMFKFPEQANGKIDSKLIKGYCMVIKYKEDGLICKRTVDLDYSSAAQLMGLSVGAVKEKYDFGFKRTT
ncbi:hypothetical protein I5T97_19590 [Serratia marcescens]|nr:hypothetical protein [Serratia marcescens]